MKKNAIMIIISITLGILFTIFVLNKENIYAKDKYIVYAFQTGVYDNIDNANNINLPAKITILEDNTYVVYTAIYKDLDIINKMLKYYKDNNIDVYLKQIKVTKDFYNILDNYEKLINKCNDSTLYNQINQSILNLFMEKEGNK